jgi:hypothetical protein
MSFENWQVGELPPAPDNTTSQSFENWQAGEMPPALSDAEVSPPPNEANRKISALSISLAIWR